MNRPATSASIARTISTSRRITPFIRRFFSASCMSFSLLSVLSELTAVRNDGMYSTPAGRSAVFSESAAR